MINALPQHLLRVLAHDPGLRIRRATRREDHLDLDGFGRIFRLGLDAGRQGDGTTRDDHDDSFDDPHHGFPSFKWLKDMLCILTSKSR